MKMKKVLFSVFIPLSVVGLILFLYTIDFYNSAVYKFYDTLLHIKPAVEEREEFLLVDIDDNTIAEVDMYPLSRKMMGDALILMKEMNAEYAVLDIEFVDKSPRGINENYLKEEFPGYLNETFGRIDQDTSALLNAISQGQIPLDAVGQYGKMLEENSRESRGILSGHINKITIDSDIYLGRACTYFGKTTVPINMLDGKDTTVMEEERNLASASALPDIEIHNDRLNMAEDIRPAILPILRGAYTLGFPRVFVDHDGVRRRIDLFYKHGNDIYPQLGISALLDFLKNPEVVIGSKEILLRGAELPGGSKEDIVIPLSEDGRMLINWPKKSYLESFDHLSFIHIYLHDRFIEDLVHNLKIMKDNNFFAFFDGDFDPLAIYTYARELKEESLISGDRIDLEEYREIREYFLSETEYFLTSGIKEELSGEYERIIGMENIPDDVKEEYRELKAWINEILFPETLSLLNEIQSVRSLLREKLEGKFCILGYSATSATDIGVNPFESEYMNMGLYASVANTVLTQKFLDETPIWINIIIIIICMFLITLIEARTKSAAGIVIGILFLIAVISGLAGLFLLYGIYTDLLSPLISIVLVFTLQISSNLISEGKEKKYIRSAFGQYLSNDVIGELIDDPSKLHLGGREIHMTAMFTDVQKFSTISEQITATELVDLLNIYLTRMSDIILDHQGTIDKFEGDAIICFYGAPKEVKDHAVQACRSAILLKKAEQEMNPGLVEAGKTPNPLMTRIGINTGPMVVGNMGTEKKMNYTMMGNAVNLAARLEGVNKQYGIYSLISESTYLETGDLFTVRMLDRVRVVGINTPVRLYHLIDEKSETPDNITQGIGLFHQGLENYEKRQWSRGEKYFRETLKILPDDGPAELYIRRISSYKKKAPSVNWDGVYNLTEK